MKINIKAVSSLFATTALFVSFLSASAAVTAVTVTSPNGSEIWGGSRTISWTHTDDGVGDNFKIYYSTDDFTSQSAISGAGNVSGNSFVWDTNTLPNGTNYKIKVYPYSDVLIFDGSDAVFAIDNTAPTIAAMVNIVGVQATGSDGATVNYSAPATADNLDAAGTATCLPASGSTFALGTTPVTCSHTDTAGNVATPVIFTVQVVDTIAPVIAFHADESAEATSASGATVTYTSPATTDAVDGAGTATCLPASGSTFALATTSVTCTKTDSHGNSAVATTFDVVVDDTTAPVIAVHANVSVSADQLGGATVVYTAPVATDAVDGPNPAICLPASGSVFLLGDTTVACNITDAHSNNAIETTFTVTVSPAIISQLEISASPTTLSASSLSTITVTGKDAYGNIVTNNNSTVVVLSADNGGSLATTLLTLTAGVNTTTLVKNTAGNVNVNVSSGVLSPSQVVVTFTVGASDTTDPTIVSHTPSDDSTSIAINSSVSVVFDEAMDAATLNGGNIQLRKYSDDSAVASVITYNPATYTVTLTPVVNLANNTQYYVYVVGAKDVSGNTVSTDYSATTKASHEFRTVAMTNGTLAVTGINTTNSTMTADNTFTNGGSWTFMITVPANQTNLKLKFADWVSGANSIATANNMRIYSAQSSNASASSTAITINAANTYPSTGLTITGDLDAVTPGYQVQVVVDLKVPTGTAGGSYSTGYGVYSESVVD